MTHKLQFALLAIMLMGISFCANAQSIITRDIAVTKPIYFHMFGDIKAKLDPSANTGTVRVFVMDNYITYEVELKGAFFEEALKSQGKPGNTVYYSWSGPTTRINAMQMTGSQSYYMVADTQQRIDGMLANNGDGWMALISKKLPGCIVDIHTGITLADVQKALKGLSQAVTLKETGTSGTMKVYTAYGAQLHDHPILNQTTVANDDPYARFYFGEDGKLVKWFIFK